ncbi:MAG: zraS 2 [Acidobacteria bacterium]|nr:zraS 2 [Acidobacteriota bacterium]
MSNQAVPAARRLPTWQWRAWPGATPNVVTLGVTALLLVLAVANIVSRAEWNPVEDGVLWTSRPEGVVAAEVLPGTPAARAGVRPGDLLLAIDARPIDRPADVEAAHAGRHRGDRVKYTLARFGATELLQFELAAVPQGNRGLYYVLAGVGIFTLLVAAGVRLRRPGNPATLHFFLLSVTFFGVFAFSHSGRFDRLDWVFYWADAISVLLLPPLFAHFTLFFPERPRPWLQSRFGPAVVPLLYLPALLLGGLRLWAVARASLDPTRYVGILQTLDRFEPLYLSLCLVGLLVVARAFRQVRSVTARRQLRWIAWGTVLGALPFTIGYALPFALGVRPTLAMELCAVPLGLIPLAFASAIVRYRLMDVEVIVKRSMVWAAAIAAISAAYAVLLRLVTWAFLPGSRAPNTVLAVLATLIVVLLARPLKNAIQATMDRAFYRDRYDYRRALVGFARDLSSDLDLARLSGRIIGRVTETLLVDRMAVLLWDERAGEFTSVRTAGLGGEIVRLPRRDSLGARLAGGQTVDLDDVRSTRGIAPSDLEPWRERELYYFLPCVSKDSTIAVLALGRKAHAEPLNSEDLALLAAVAGQAATALENGRLYRQLHVKADELGRMRAFNESILESLEVGLAVVDEDDRVVRWNRALEALVGVSRQDAVGRGLRELFPPGVFEPLRRAREQAPRGASLYRLSLPAPGEAAGGRRLANVTTVPLQPGEGNPANGTIILVEDVSTRVQLEEQVQISEKMASIGLLAAGVAHEVNTPLTGISSFTQMLLEGADPADPKTRVLEKIERQTFRAAKIVNGLLNLSRPGAAAAERAPVDLNVVINDVLSLLEHQFKVGHVQVRRDLASPGPVVLGIEHKLQQVFLNLFLNARDAMPKGGWLSIATRASDGLAIAEVADTGAGIPSDQLPRIYDPFFTTKIIGQGTGLGLSVTYGIVREHDGGINCESQVGVGTRFTLTFPAAAPAASRPHRAG